MLQELHPGCGCRCIQYGVEGRKVGASFERLYVRLGDLGSIESIAWVSLLELGLGRMVHSPHSPSFVLPAREEGVRQDGVLESGRARCMLSWLPVRLKQSLKDQDAVHFFCFTGHLSLCDGPRSISSDLPSQQLLRRGGMLLLCSGLTSRKCMALILLMQLQRMSCTL